jgi:hypothetical protein
MTGLAASLALICACGQPGFDLRLLIKVLVYAYSTGIHSSRQMERLCDESLPYLFLTRGDAPSYRTLCSARINYPGLIEEVWIGLFAVARKHGLKRCGKIVIDSSKFRANASSESVIKAKDYAAIKAELQRVLTEAELADRREDQDGGGPGTRLGKSIAPDQMRDLLRRVRAEHSGQSEKDAAQGTEGTQKPASPVEAVSEAVSASVQSKPIQITRKMAERIRMALRALEHAQALGLKQLCLTDPDARMMMEGRLKRLRECHAFEVAVDQGLLVAAQTYSGISDNARLIPLVDAARILEPEGIKALDADSGYWRGDDVASLQASGIDTCIPDSHTACDLHRSDPIGTTKQRIFSKVPMTYDPQTDAFRCPEDNVLTLIRTSKPHGQESKEYRAKKPCTDCSLVAQCLTQKSAKHRTLHVAVRRDEIQAILARFNEPEHQERYHHRGDAVETVFGFMRSVLRITRWQLRGTDRVAAEGKLIACAYQVRKIQSHIKAAVNAKREQVYA